jgi:hypothetical protein
MSVHAQLVRAGGDWLRFEKHCAVVLLEPARRRGERPDLIGWHHEHDCTWTSYLIECKASKEDLRADRKKIWRGLARGLGMFRYLLIPEQFRLITNDVPPHWGILEMGDHREVRVVSRPEVCFDQNTKAEELGLCLDLLVGKLDTPGSLDRRRGREEWERSVVSEFADGVELRHLVRDHPHPVWKGQKAIDYLADQLRGRRLLGWSLYDGWPLRIKDERDEADRAEAAG